MTCVRSGQASKEDTYERGKGGGEEKRVERGGRKGKRGRGKGV